MSNNQELSEFNGFLSALIDRYKNGQVLTCPIIKHYIFAKLITKERFGRIPLWALPEQLGH